MPHAPINQKGPVELGTIYVKGRRIPVVPRQKLRLRPEQFNRLSPLMQEIVEIDRVFEERVVPFEGARELRSVRAELRAAAEALFGPGKGSNKTNDNRPSR